MYALGMVVMVQSDMGTTYSQVSSEDEQYGSSVVEPYEEEPSGPSTTTYSIDAQPMCECNFKHPCFEPTSGTCVGAVSINSFVSGYDTMQYR